MTKSFAAGFPEYTLALRVNNAGLRFRNEYYTDEQNRMEPKRNSMYTLNVHSCIWMWQVSSFCASSNDLYRGNVLKEQETHLKMFVKA